MLLKSLELQGFKTFPDKTKLEFEQGITSVVGPNGSGKSNISDAMRWVLGEQSVRTLRCSKMEDVVFSGTPQRKAQGYAEVTLNIDNTDRRLEFDNDNVAITRRYYRSGESEYLINKTIVRLKDINELFMDTGLGRDGYSIIGQGKIDSIVAAKSEDRREIFEEASGISRYRYRKEESERRLNRAEENLVRLRDILSELEDRVEPLRIQAEKAEQFIEYDAEKKELEIGIWVETLNQSGKVLREHNEKMDISKSRYDDLNNEIETLTQQNESHYRQLNELAAARDFDRNEAARFDQEAVRSEGNISVHINNINNIEQNLKRINDQIEVANLSSKDIDDEVKAKLADIEQKDKSIEESRKKYDNFTAKLEELRQGADESTTLIEKAALELAEINAKLSEEIIKLSSAQSSSVEIAARSEAVEESLKTNVEKIEKLETELSELKTMLADIEEKVASTENSLKGYEMRLDSRRNKAEAAKAEADKLLLEATNHENRAKLLSDLERNLEGFAGSVKAIVKDGERGLLSGIHGPVTKIIKTPKEYAVALETALGAAMQNVVVETENDAKSAINYLKKKGIGRATFLPRTTIKGNVMDKREIEELPGFIGIASELCSSDAKFEGIRNQLLGRVAVAEDLDSAVAIAKRIKYRYRIVSLDGQVVNAGGSLTGGAQARNSGLLSRASDIERITQEAAKLREKAEQAAAEYKERQTELSSSEAEIEALKGELAAVQEDRIKVSSEVTRFGHELESAKLEKAQLEQEQESAKSRMDELEKAQADSSARIKELEVSTEAAQKSTEKLAANREDQMARCDDITSTINEIRMAELSAKKDKDSLLQSIDELEARKLDSSGSVKLLFDEIEQLKKESTELEGQIEASKQEAESYRRKAEEKRKESEEKSEKRSALEKQQGELHRRERDIADEREKISGELARLQERSENFQREYDSIIQRLWEEYELTRSAAEELGTEIEDMPKAQRRLNELKSKIKALGSVNVAAVVEYKEVSERYEFLKEQIDDVEKSKAELIKLIGELTKHMREQFIERFAEINKNFKSIFKELFGGGDANLKFADESDVLTSGIDIEVHPPGKIVTHIESLSGGEKALVAISIYFAIMRVSPPPFCVLDEIEAALDDVNVSRFAQYLRRMSDNSQYIVITHRRGTMEESDMLYGVTMQDQGISKLLALKTQEEADNL